MFNKVKSNLLKNNFPTQFYFICFYELSSLAPFMILRVPTKNNRTHEEACCVWNVLEYNKVLKTAK